MFQRNTGIIYAISLSPVHILPWSRGVVTTIWFFQSAVGWHENTRKWKWIVSHFPLHAYVTALQQRLWRFWEAPTPCHRVPMKFWVAMDFVVTESSWRARGMQRVVTTYRRRAYNVHGASNALLCRLHRVCTSISEQRTRHIADIVIMHMNTNSVFLYFA